MFRNIFNKYGIAKRLFFIKLIRKNVLQRF